MGTNGSTPRPILDRIARRRRSNRGFGQRPRFVPIETLDIGCPTCGATYTECETHDCPGYNLWAPRPTLPVGVRDGAGHRIVVAKRTARKEYRCESNRVTDPPSAIGCLAIDPHIHPGEPYMEVYEGDDEFHPLRYHARCAIAEWNLTAVPA